MSLLEGKEGDMDRDSSLNDIMKTMTLKDQRSVVRDWIADKRIIIHEAYGAVVFMALEPDDTVRCLFSRPDADSVPGSFHLVEALELLLYRDEPTLSVENPKRWQDFF